MENFDFPRQYTIPSLDEIISPNTYLADCGPYNRGLFVQFLLNSHCMENLEFVVELDRFLANMSAAGGDSLPPLENSRLLHQWSVIYKVFLQHDAIKEINVACETRREVHETTLPSQRQVARLRALIYELLLDSYNEFVSYTREATNDRTTRRRRLEIVPPEFKTAPQHDRSYPVVFENVPRSLASLPDEKPSQLRAQWDRALDQLESTKDGPSVLVHAYSGSELTLDLSRSRTALAGTISTRNSSRGSSIGSIVDNLKDYTGWKTVKKLRFRRSLNDQDIEA